MSDSHWFGSNNTIRLLQHKDFSQRYKIIHVTVVFVMVNDASITGLNQTFHLTEVHLHANDRQIPIVMLIKCRLHNIILIGNTMNTH